MPVYLLDSSALAKRYVAETGSMWIAGLMYPSAVNQINVARTSGVEVVAAITRRVRAGGMRADAGAAAITQFRNDFEKLVRVEISPALVYRAMDLAERNVLRGYDAVQLASAMTLHERYQSLGLSMTLVSADEELDAAALAEGLQAENLSRGAPKPASAGRSKPASVVMRRIPHSFGSVQLSVELSASVQGA